jgi:hypothetical protein
MLNYCYFIRPFLIASGCLMSAEAARLPVITILYPPGGSLLDRLCKSDFKTPFSDEALQAAARQRPAFQKQWDAEGPVYLKAAIAEIGLQFPYREMQATLTVCLPASTSVPLIIDVAPFLSTTAKRDPDWEFSEVVFHELMHTYVTPVLADSALMKKYKDEPPTTKFHLHVMAMEVITLRKLNRVDRLKVIDHDYRNGPDVAYRRAWEIVNDIEGYQHLVDELKALNKVQNVIRMHPR